jgi:hypothetical protein
MNNTIDKIKVLNKHFQDLNVPISSIGIGKDSLIVYLWKETKINLPKNWEGLDITYVNIGKMSLNNA